MALAAELTSFYNNLLRSQPAPVARAFQTASMENETAFDRGAAVKVGDELPDFTCLLDESGNALTREELLAKGPILMRFHRGGWCPLCNIEMRSLQKYVRQFQEEGVTLVMISPDLPHESLSRKETMKLDFLMLSDAENELAGKLGIVAGQPESLRPILTSLNSRFEDPKQSLAVPICSTLLVDSNGVVRQSCINPRYPERLEPATALEWIKEANLSKRAVRPAEKTDTEIAVQAPTRATSRYGWPG